MQGSTSPFPDETPRGVMLRCEAGHSQTWYLHGLSRREAEDYAAMLDGTSPIYVSPPRDDPTNRFIGRCQGLDGSGCGALFRAETFGYDDDDDAHV